MTRTFSAVCLFLALFGKVCADDMQAVVAGAFETYCFKCHGAGEDVEGEVDLKQLSQGGKLFSSADVLQALTAVIRDGEMPPEDETQLPTELRKQILTGLQEAFDASLKNQPFEPTPIRRMNRFQYNNAVVDLLELDRDIFQMNERLMRRREDYFHPATRRMPDRVRVSCRPLSKDIDNQRPEGFRGVAAFPQDQRAEHGFDNRADHLSLSPLLMESFLQLSKTISASPDLNPDECRSWDRVFAPPSGPVRVPKDGRYEGEHTRWLRIVARSKGKVSREDGRLFWWCPDKDLDLTLEFDVNQSATGIQLTLTKAADYGQFRLTLNGKELVANVDLYSMDPSSETIRVDELQIEPGQQRLRIRCIDKHDDSSGYYFGLDCLEFIGQPDASKSPDNDLAAIRAYLKPLLRRAFRRPIDDETLEQFSRFAEQEYKSGNSFEGAMRAVVGAIIGMPEFLYFYETSGEAPKDDESGGRQRISDFELASRLSQFFWSSIPDDQLLELAERGQLRNRDVLSSQIDRMMDDRRSGRFCDNFPGQWLQLDRLVTAIPDRQKFAYFYYNGYRSSMHMMSEPLLLFETVFVEDRSVLELIDAPFTWESEMLAANYEGRGNARIDVQVQPFRRVAIDDPRRGGVITNAAVMTMTSSPTRTQPITRGAWVNSVIFNDPPEPPPADVPPLPEDNAEELAKMTIRERLAAHRKRADCAGCHNKIDPLGFALENFGPTGVWRDQYENGRDVDASGELFNEHEFKSVAEFKQILLEEKHRFIRAFASHLLSYALGRELGPADSPTLDEITDKAVAGEASLRSVLKNVAMSESFLHKNTTRQ